MVTDLDRRNLHWLGACPGLFHPDGDLPLVAASDRQDLLGDAEPNGPVPIGGRLGKYAEALWTHALEQTLPGKVVRNRIFVDDGLTLGEADLLWLNEAVCRWWELTVKFYLWTGRGDGSDLATWIGVAGKDSLKRKYLRLRDHQLCLHLDPRVQSQLGDVKSGSLQPAVWAVGRLMVPMGMVPVLPPEVNPDVELIPWLERRHFEKISHGATRSARWRTCGPRERLAPLQGGEDLLAFRQLADKIPTETSVYVARMINGADGWVEDRRFLIVPDGWPPE